jgi:hypothetical protein
MEVAGWSRHVERKFFSGTRLGSGQRRGLRFVDGLAQAHRVAEIAKRARCWKRPGTRDALEETQPLGIIGEELQSPC